MVLVHETASLREVGSAHE